VPEFKFLEAWVFDVLNILTKQMFLELFLEANYFSL
jgi:hypothetical protein